MPTYDYRCDSCGHEFEEFQTFSAGALRKCPECKKLRLKRLIGSGAGILFKGSGFYETDYRSESYKKAAASDKPSTDAGANDPAAKKPDATKPAASKPESGSGGKKSSKETPRKAPAPKRS